MAGNKRTRYAVVWVAKGYNTTSLIAEATGKPWRTVNASLADAVNVGQLVRVRRGVYALPNEEHHNES
jgi:hypothetical protein